MIVYNTWSTSNKKKEVVLWKHSLVSFSNFSSSPIMSRATIKTKHQCKTFPVYDIKYEYIFIFVHYFLYLCIISFSPP